MTPDLTIALLAVWAAGLVTLPLWVLLAGALGARARDRREAREPAPRPADEHAPGARVVAGLREPDRAFALGLAAGRAFSPKDAEEARSVLASHHDVIADVERAPGGGFRVLVRASRTGLGAPVVGEPVCHFDRGVVAALFEAIVRGPVNVRETRCRGAGDNRCAFEVDLLAPVVEEPEPEPVALEDEAIVPGALSVALLAHAASADAHANAERDGAPGRSPAAGGGA